MIKLSPSILAADPLRLGQAARMAQDAGCDELHFDVMDGHFVPNLTFGPHILKAMKQELPQIVYDVHLMLDNPAEFVDPFIDAGADILTVHAEADGFVRALGFAGEIEADGGITESNAALLKEAGIGVLVMGTGFFRAKDPAEVVRRVHAL